jgi:translation initiation factor 2B subunit (eIF-2B alpha/beta/delta family)
LLDKFPFHLYSKQTYDTLTKAGVPCTLILDSALAFVMDKVDLCLVGSEAVVESGGLVNAGQLLPFAFSILPYIV